MNMTTPTFTPTTRVRLTVPGTYADHDGIPVRLKATWVFRVLDQTGDMIRVVHDLTGRRYVLPANQLTRA